jgi:hypothetical protein
MISFGLEENLCFMLQAPKSLAVRDSVYITLEARPDIAFGFRTLTPFSLFHKRCKRREYSAFKLLSFFSRGGHVVPSFFL